MSAPSLTVELLTRYGPRFNLAISFPNDGTVELEAPDEIAGRFFTIARGISLEDVVAIGCARLESCRPGAVQHIALPDLEDEG